MSVSEILVKAGGIILFVVGLALLLAAVNVSLFGITLNNIVENVIGGVLFLGAGVVLIRGGNITL